MLTEAKIPLAEILSRQPLFRGLSNEELHPIALGSRDIRASRNEILFQKGDESHGMYVLVMGQVKLSLPSAHGAEKVVSMCEAGSTFGEAMVFLDRPYPVTAQAIQDCLLVLVSKAALLEALDASTLLSRKIIANLSIRLHEMLDDMETCTLRTSTQRVICFLGNLAPPGQPEHFEVTLPASKQTIASQLNLAPETFSRVLGHLMGAGLIQVKGRTVRILNFHGLRNYTN